MLVNLNYGTIITTDETVIANILFPTGVTTFQIQGSIIVAPNTSAGFRGIAVSKKTNMALNVSWLEIPAALFY